MKEYMRFHDIHLRWLVKMRQKPRVLQEKPRPDESKEAGVRTPEKPPLSICIKTITREESIVTIYLGVSVIWQVKFVITSITSHFAVERYCTIGTFLMSHTQLRSEKS